MANPIPNIDLRYLSKLDAKPQEKSIIDEAIQRLPKSNSTKDLLLGTFSGWVAGVCITKVGKVASFGLGGSIILLHFASELGYINVNWERIKEAISRNQELVDKALRFVKKNSCFSVGCVGGFFFGMASA